MGEEETPPVVEKVEDKLDSKVHLSVHDLNALRDELKAEMRSIRSDKATDAEEKTRLEAKVEYLQEQLEEMMKAAEEKEKTHSDSTTIVIPPPELNPPTHINKEQEPSPENTPTTTHKKKGWKKLY